MNGSEQPLSNGIQNKSQKGTFNIVKTTER